VADRVVLVWFSANGVVTELRLVDGQDHAFDEHLGSDDAIFPIVREGLEFLAKYARAGSR